MASVPKAEDFAGARARHLAIQNLLLRRGAVARALHERRFEAVADLVEYLRSGIPNELAHTDPALFCSLRQAQTRYLRYGYYLLSEEALRSKAKQQNNGFSPESDS